MVKIDDVMDVVAEAGQDRRGGSDRAARHLCDATNW